VQGKSADDALTRPAAARDVSEKLSWLRRAQSIIFKDVVILKIKNKIVTRVFPKHFAPRNVLIMTKTFPKIFAQRKFFVGKVLS